MKANINQVLKKNRWNIGWKILVNDHLLKLYEENNILTTRVDDAIHHGSLLYIGEILKEGKPLEMFVDVTIAAPDPDSVDTEAVLEVLPFGERTIKVVAGGMAWGKEEDPLIVCNAAVEVSVES